MEFYSGQPENPAASVRDYCTGVLTLHKRSRPHTTKPLAGIDGASSHSGRRQFVTNLADEGTNARVVKALARHKHLGTTQRYIDINDNKLRTAVELI